MVFVSVTFTRKIAFVLIEEKKCPPRKIEF